MTRRGPSRVIVASGPALVRRRIFARSASPVSWAALPETKVWREAEVLPASKVRSVSPTTSSNCDTGTPSASAAICVSTVVEPWPMSTAPFQKVSLPSRASVMRMVEGFDMPVLPMPYHMQPMPTPRRVRVLQCVEGGGVRVEFGPARAERVETLREAGAGVEALARIGGVAGAQCIDVAELEAVDAGFGGEVVVERLVRDGRLRNAEAAEGAGGRFVGENCARAVAHVGNFVGAGAVYGHAAGDGGAPGGVGAGVEVAVGFVGDEAALGVAGGAGFDLGGVALGGGGHRTRCARRRSAPAASDARRRPRASAARRRRACRRSRRRRRSGRCGRFRAAGRGRGRPRRDPSSAPACWRRPPCGRRRGRRSRLRARCRRARRRRSRMRLRR